MGGLSDATVYTGRDTQRSIFMFTGMFVWGVLSLLAFRGDARAAIEKPLGRQFGMSLQLRHLTQSEVSPLGAFLDEAERLLPPRVKAMIQPGVSVEFAPLDARREIAPPPCPGPDSRDAATPQTLAEFSLSQADDAPHRIVLHAAWKPIITSGRDAARSYGCGHKSMYQLAVATLIHEVFHIYDARSKLSRAPRFQHLARFAPQGISRRLAPRNQLFERSPDPYEFHDIYESLAVNAEYFLLDPEFRCRRPATYQFLESELHYRPFPHERCTVNDTVFAHGQPLSIDPDRIYEVHYLLASAGTGIGSRFGHSMFRLVVCAEDRAVVGPECLDDVQDHIVLGFAANLQGDRGVSAWKGLTGSYLSQLFIKPLPEVIIEYTEREFRDLDSIPLRLTGDEKRQFIYRALEIYWSYKGRYFFLTNNCAVESLSLLKSVLQSPQVQSIDRITPTGLRTDFARLGLTRRDLHPDREQEERIGLRFPSLFDKYDAAFHELLPNLPKEAPRDLRRYLDDTRALSRRRWVSQIAGNDASKLTARAFALEGLILNRTLREAERLLVGFVNRGPQDAQKRALLSRLDALLQLYGQDVPWRRAKPGYGVPLRQEILEVPQDARQRMQRQLLAEAMSVVRDRFPNQYAEWRFTLENRNLILQRLATESARALTVASIDRKDGDHAP